MRKLSCLLAILIAAGLLLFLIGCAGDDDSGNGGPGNGGNCDAAEAKVQEANAVLEDVLYDLINGDPPQEPEDIDFSEPYNLYMEALGYCSPHVGANFGAGMVEVMMLTRDPEFQTFFDRVKAFIDAGEYFEVPGGTFLGGPIDVSAPVFRLDQLAFPLMAPVKITRRMCRTMDEDDPTVTELQGICLNEVLPRIRTAVERLSIVAEDEGFVFTVTPRMQGDPGEDALELDQTEVRATLAGLQAVEALFWHFCAYNLNFDAYDGEGMVAAFTLGSSFAALHLQGESRMESARQAWLGAAANLDWAIEFLESETDYQGDDIIRIDPYDDITQADLDSIKHYLPLIQNALNSSQVFSIDTDGNPATPDEEIEISLDALFGTPVQDLKALFPPYTVSLDTQAVEWVYVYGSDEVIAQVEIDSAGYYQWYRWAWYEYGEEVTHWENINLTVPEWEQAWNAKVQQLSNSPYAWLEFYFYDYLTAGSHTVVGYLSYSYNEPTRARYTPRITWQANSFAEWDLPDPTIGGLFPGMTPARFKEIFGLTAEHWEKSTTWYLW